MAAKGLPRGGSTSLRHRPGSGGGSSNGMIARLPAFAKHRKLAKVADTVDQWSLWMGLYLRNNAYARLYFLVYVLLLHAWMFVLVSVKVHSFEQVHGDHHTLNPLAPSGLLQPQDVLQVATVEEVHLGAPARDPPALGAQ